VTSELAPPYCEFVSRGVQNGHFVLYSAATAAARRTAAAFIVSQPGQDAKGSPKWFYSTGFGDSGNHSRIA